MEVRLGQLKRKMESGYRRLIPGWSDGCAMLSLRVSAEELWTRLKLESMKERSQYRRLQ